MFEWLRRLFGGTAKSAQPAAWVRRPMAMPQPGEDASVWTRRIIAPSGVDARRPAIDRDTNRRLLGSFDRLDFPILVFDTETTGVMDDDRVVSFGAVMLNSMQQKPDGSRNMNFAPTHFVFNPGRSSHPMAQKVHGHTDHELSFQEPFAARAAEIAELFERARLVVCHNVAFDLKFIEREMRLAGVGMRGRETFCTMRAAQRDPALPNGKLDDLARLIGMPRAGAHHGALEDAWITMHVFFRLKVGPGIAPTPFSALPNPGFENYRAVTPPESAPTLVAKRRRTKKAPDA